MAVDFLPLRPIKTLAPLVGLFVVAFSYPTFSQASLLGKNCDLAILGATEKKGFLAFDQEFRYALSNHDAGAMALLVKPSLRVNDDRGSYYIEDARSLQLRLEEIFTLGVKEAVFKERTETLSCAPTGVRYGDGIVWVEFTGNHYAIEAVNVPEKSRVSKTQERTIEFACNADKHRVIVDTVGEGAPRYRAWTKPHSLAEKPDLEIAAGKREFQGSGVCAYTSWTFNSGGATFQVDGPGGCYEASKQPPASSRGSLEVSVPGKQEVNWWCY